MKQSLKLLKLSETLTLPVVSDW